MPIRCSRHYLAFVGSLLMHSCCVGSLDAQRVSPGVSSDLRTAGRRALPFKLAERWRRVGSEHDTLLFQPGSMIANDMALWVVDFAPPRIVMLDRQSGAVLRQVGQTGGGPREWLGPLSFTGTVAGNTGVFDVTSRRMFWIARDGKIADEESLANAPLPRHVCAVSSSKRLFSSGSQGRSRLGLFETGKAADAVLFELHGRTCDYCRSWPLRSPSGQPEMAVLLQRCLALTWLGTIRTANWWIRSV